MEGEEIAPRDQWRKEKFRSRLRFCLCAEDGEADAGRKKKNGESDGNFHGLFLSDIRLDGTNFRDFLGFVVSEMRMDKADRAREHQEDAKHQDESLHELKPYHRWERKRECLKIETPLRFERHRGVFERDENLRARSGSSSGLLRGFRGRGGLAAALGLGWNGGRFADELSGHDAGDKELGTMIVKINRGALLIG